MAALTDWRAGFHLFGYSDKTPWSADGSLMLGLRTALSPRDLGPGDSAQIGLIPFAKGGNHLLTPAWLYMFVSILYSSGRGVLGPGDCAQNGINSVCVLTSVDRAPRSGQVGFCSQRSLCDHGCGHGI